jgi:hypothetical protein
LVDRGQTGINATSRSLVVRFGLLLLFTAAEIVGQTLLRLAAHDLIARLGGPIGERARIGQLI